MYNTDTLELGINFRDRKKISEDLIGEEKEEIDWEYIRKIDKKIKQKLYLNDRERNKLIKRIEYQKKSSWLKDTTIRVEKGINYYPNKNDCIFYKGSFNGYNFAYNSSLYTLTIMHENKNIEKYNEIQIIENTKRCICEYFELEEGELEEITLRRIDFHNDYKYKDSLELLVIKYIISIAKDSIYTYKKEIIEEETKYVVNYISKTSGNTNHEIIINKNSKLKQSTRNYSTSNYSEITTYDKHLEMENKYKRGKTTMEEVGKYKNTLRTEVKIKNGKLNANKTRYGGSKKINDYYNEESYRKCYVNNITRVYGKQKFYRIDIAKKIIQENNELKNNMKDKLCELLELVCTRGYSKTEERWKNKNSRNIFRNHKKRIEALGINILTYPVEINGKRIEYENINNFAIYK